MTIRNLQVVQDDTCSTNKCTFKALMDGAVTADVEVDFNNLTLELQPKVTVTNYLVFGIPIEDLVMQIRTDVEPNTHKAEAPKRRLLEWASNQVADFCSKNNFHLWKY